MKWVAMLLVAGGFGSLFAGHVYLCAGLVVAALVVVLFSKV